MTPNSKVLCSCVCIQNMVMPRCIMCSSNFMLFHVLSSLDYYLENKRYHQTNPPFVCPSSGSRARSSRVDSALSICIIAPIYRESSTGRARVRARVSARMPAHTTSEYLNMHAVYYRHIFRSEWCDSCIIIIIYVHACVMLGIRFAAVKSLSSSLSFTSIMMVTRTQWLRAQERTYLNVYLSNALHRIL